ncbi:MAG TPA: GyrI-like domain-containing protein [Acidisarcina sp.]
MNPQPDLPIAKLRYCTLICAGLLAIAPSAGAGGRDGASSPKSSAAAQSPAAASQSAPATPAAAKPAAPAETPKPKIEQQEAFWVAGQSVRTKNSVEAGPGGQIGPLWQSFLQQDTASTIPDRVGTDFYVVYSDYESDVNGSYNYTLGVKVSSIDHLPAGLVARQVPAGHYAIVPSETGALPQVVPAVWRRIWTMTPEQLGGKRALKADFEVYDLQGIDIENSQVDVHVGLQ